ncbi:MAG: DNA (cytosine-5-)-methyltransferase [Anaerolineaceae bacterium]|nr:DNA (cytosine-5-)-methyltransferase [Anaerolineaceae bacterium]MBN2678122.1 DNA (cytosine-5-)-methyltransferase [Anaerolineaceae bacterium]
MGDNILVRKIPADLRNWIELERQQYQMTQQEFVLSVLKDASTVYQPTLTTNSTKQVVGVTNYLPFTFIDLFAGIGGFRLALTKLGGTCIFSSEWDKYSQKTYKAWFNELPFGDIRQIDPESIPNHDILAAGFPCQPFSIAGVSKKNSLGKAHGFDDIQQGNLFFVLANIIRVKRPPVLFLENVKNLKSHDHGRTWKVIKEKLEELDYWVNAKVIDASGWVPQHRERIYIVCFDKRTFSDRPDFVYPVPESGSNPIFADILENAPDNKYTLTDHLWNYLQKYAEKHKAKGNGFGYGLVDINKISRTLSARYYKDGSEILIPQPNKNPRRLTPLECSRLMGFEDREIVVSDTQAYRQFGNAVVPKVVEAIGKEIVRVIDNHYKSSKRCLLKTS